MADDPFGEITARTFGLLSRLRGKRVFHPHGVGFGGELRPSSSVGIDLYGTAPKSVVARLSRSAGLPESLRDPCGIGLRIADAHGKDAHQDLLLVSSSGLPAARHLLLPARDFASRFYSTLLPYRLDGRLVLFGATTEAGPEVAPTLAELSRRDQAGLALRLLIAPAWGRWQEIAKIELQERVPDDEIEALRLDPSNTGRRLELAGLLNRLRRPAYRGSQDARLLSRRGPPPLRASASPDGRRSDGAPGSGAPTRPAP